MLKALSVLTLCCVLVPLARAADDKPATLTDDEQNCLVGRYTEEAVSFVRGHKDGPFFLYLAHTFPHVPLFASGKFSGQSRRGLYGDVVEEVDWSVGQVVEVLDTAKQGGALKVAILKSETKAPVPVGGR